MDSHKKLKEDTRKVLSSSRPRRGIDRTYPEGMSRLRRAAASILPTIIDPIEEDSGIQRFRTARDGNFMGRVLRRRSGIIERHKALSSAPSGEGVRLAVSVLPLPEHASEVRPDGVAPHESPGPVRQMSLPGIEVSKVEAAECDAVTPEEEAEFQKDLERIRAAENQAATEGRNIILGGDSLG